MCSLTATEPQPEDWGIQLPNEAELAKGRRRLSIWSRRAGGESWERWLSLGLVTEHAEPLGCVTTSAAKPSCCVWSWFPSSSGLHVGRVTPRGCHGVAQWLSGCDTGHWSARTAPQCCLGLSCPCKRESLQTGNAD